MNNYGYNLARLIIVIVCFFSLLFIHDTLSDIKGEFDVVVC